MIEIVKIVFQLLLKHYQRWFLNRLKAASSRCAKRIGCDQIEKAESIVYKDKERNRYDNGITVKEHVVNGMVLIKRSHYRYYIMRRSP